MNSTDCTFIVKWSEEDKCFVARVQERSFFSAQGGTPEEAIRELGGMLETIDDDVLHVTVFGPGLV